MTKPKPPRVLNYDEEFGYIVAGTHDVAAASILLAEHVAKRGDPPLVEQSSIEPPQPIWMRCSMAHYDGDHAWMREDTEPHARGAFRAVIWERKG